jgi:hypothetical protein
MSASKEAERAAERMRALCHELNHSTTPQDLYGVAGSMAAVMRAFEQVCRQVADQLDRTDPAGYRDDREGDGFDRTEFVAVTLDAAATRARLGDMDDVQNILSHVGSAR